MKKGKLLWMGVLLSFALAACGQEVDKDDTPSGGSSVENEQTQDQGSEPAEEDNNTSAADVSMDDIKAAVVKALGEEDYIPNLPIEGDLLSDRYGVTEDMYDDFLAEIPLTSINVDSLIIIKAKEGQVDAVESALNSYRDNQVNDAFQYPMNVPKIQASRIEVIGNYVCYVQLGGNISDIMEQGDDAVIEHCQEDNELAIETIRNLVMQ